MEPMCSHTLCQPVEYRKLQARTETPQLVLQPASLPAVAMYS